MINETDEIQEEFMDSRYGSAMIGPCSKIKLLKKHMLVLNGAEELGIDTVK